MNAVSHGLRSIAICGGMSPVDFNTLVEGSQLVDLGDAKQIFAQGDPADSVYAIVGGAGTVRIGSADRRGKALMIEVVQVGEIFGELGVIEGKPRTASAVTEGRVRLVRIGASAFRNALNHSPQFSAALCRLLAKRLRRTFELLQDASFEPLEVRLARQILYLAGLGTRLDKDGVRLTRRVRQGDLADLLGATTRSIITILNAWRAAGIVAYDTSQAVITIVDRPALETLVRQSREG